jgi:hypothetical protein
MEKVKITSMDFYITLISQNSLNFMNSARFLAKKGGFWYTSKTPIFYQISMIYWGFCFIMAY